MSHYDKELKWPDYKSRNFIGYNNALLCCEKYGQFFETEKFCVGQVKKVESPDTSPNTARQAPEAYVQISARMLELAAEPSRDGYVSMSPETLREWAQKLLSC